MRQELWSNLANKLAEVFDSPMEPEKVKQHFHNRRKAVMGRVRDDLKRHGMEQASVEEKMDWIKNRRVVVNENDLQIIEYFFNKEQDRDTTPAPLAPLNAVVTTNEFDTTAMNFLNGLVKSDSSTCEGEMPGVEEVVDDVSSSNGPIENHEPISLGLFNPQLYLGPSKSIPEVSSQLIIEVSNKEELKRLLSLLIDNDFTRFAHFDEPPLKHFGMKVCSSQKRMSSKRKLHNESQITKKSANSLVDMPSLGTFMNGQEASDPISLLSDPADLNAAANLLIEMTKTQTEDEEVDEEDDINISNNVLQDLVKSFGPPEAKKKPGDGISIKCELCKNVVRLNQSGSKWNLYEHVVLNHSTHRPYKCTKCNYSGVRKGRVRQHIMSAHECDEQPENVATADVKEVWDAKMTECFPNHKQLKSTSPISVSS